MKHGFPVRCNVNGPNRRLGNHQQQHSTGLLPQYPVRFTIRVTLSITFFDCSATAVSTTKTSGTLTNSDRKSTTSKPAIQLSTLQLSPAEKRFLVPTLYSTKSAKRVSFASIKSSPETSTSGSARFSLLLLSHRHELQLDV